MTCGLAEEETRLVTSRAEGVHRPPAARVCVMGFYLADIREHRIYVARELRDILRKPRIRDRPQTACGRSCPWEPTALRIRAITVITHSRKALKRRRCQLNNFVGSSGKHGWHRGKRGCVFIGQFRTARTLRAD